MQIESLGHVVIKVRDVERSEAFYNGVLGLPVVARSTQAPMTFFSLGDHHDFAILAVGDDAESPGGKAVGLAHVAFKIGTTLDELKDAKQHLDERGIESAPVDHEVNPVALLRRPRRQPGRVVRGHVGCLEVRAAACGAGVEARTLSGATPPAPAQDAP